ncbi:MAG: hypothetical protein A2782_03955 [Candidatus Blackburnbacteria bacterium RIFCSPHIGHO2_01_FULL_43_15b]|uniref:Uncharacterized protein n=1 Tax=Candidatus Blackburnbacteria bacterium RIFCSPHIGHO2_01_FULL_43_15b TaxID=1797513 RepID=A0A1G1UZJ5_9BACT|nr:MAG: hypothetical protein A2782_03955 [Candidatus Blackburnbacteria bacterium RIFCSPHIGHO2_01_FULL_43_15b]
MLERLKYPTVPQGENLIGGVNQQERSFRVTKGNPHRLYAGVHSVYMNVQDIVGTLKRFKELAGIHNRGGRLGNLLIV